MRHLGMCGLLLGLASGAWAQLSVYPLAGALDARTGAGVLEVRNGGDAPMEVVLELAFGYPITDSLGVLSILYPDPPSKSPFGRWNLTPYLRYFPQRFRLGPAQSQTVRLLARLPAGAPPGVYWTRLTVQGTPPPRPLTTLEDQELQAQIIGRQNIVVYLRHGSVEARPFLEGVDLWARSDSILVRLRLRTQDEIPALGTLRYRLRRPDGTLVAEGQEYVPLYGSLIRIWLLPRRQLPAGTYALEVEYLPERPDLETTKLIPFRPVQERLSVRVPG